MNPITPTTENPTPDSSGAKGGRIDLGLAILSAMTPPSFTYTQEEIAAFCDCTHAMISSIETRALRRLRKKVRAEFKISRFDRNERLRFLAMHLQS